MRHLKDRESKQIIKDFTTRFPASTKSLDLVRHLEEEMVEDNLVLFADDKPWIVRIQGRLFPSLKYDQVLVTLPKIIVDMGAVPHIANGAQIMRPGIRQIEGHFNRDDVIIIEDERHRKMIALGIAETDSEQMRTMTKGRVIANIHYVGDPLWQVFAKKPKID